MSPSAWQPAGAGTSSIDNPEIRAGTFRASMKNNPLLAKADLGAVRESPEKKMRLTKPSFVTELNFDLTHPMNNTDTYVPALTSIYRIFLLQTKKMIFSSPAPDHVFGYMPTPDPEGAREITMIWKSHDPNAGADTNPDRKPKLDFTKMNKLASAR